MENTKEVELKLDEYLKLIHIITEENTTINDILQYMIDADAVVIGENRLKFATLFCRTISIIKKPSADVKNLMIKAFTNIRTMSKKDDDDKSGELETIFFLNQLYSSYASKTYKLNGRKLDNFKKFELLLENLEKISIIFSLTDQESHEYFPIASFFDDIIKDDDIQAKFDSCDTNTIHTIMLAMQIFRYNPQIEKKNQLIKYLSEKNIEFINYLLNNAIRLHGEAWKVNYENNGTLVLYNPNTQKVLIRNRQKDYFSIDENIRKKYGIHEVKKEKNNQDRIIGYYVEYELNNLDLKDFKYVSFENEIKNTSSTELLIKMLNLIYEQGYYNIFMEDSVFIKENEVMTVNPFSIHDSVMVVGTKICRNKKKELYEHLKEFGLKKLCGNGIDIINLGTLAKLESIYTVQLKDLLVDNNTTFNVLLHNWLSKCEDPLDCFSCFFKDYKDHLEYIKESKSMIKKNWDKDAFYMPYFIDESLLEKLDVNEKLRNLDIVSVKVEKDFDDTLSLSSYDGNKNYQEYRVEFLCEEISQDNIDEKDYIMFIDENQKILYVGTKRDIIYGKIKKELQKFNKNTLPGYVTKTICNTHVTEIEKMMQNFSEAYKTIHGEIVPLYDIGIYRIANHLLLLKIKEENIPGWFNLLKQHSIINYSCIKDTDIFKKTGVLYIPKEVPEKQSTLAYIYEKYSLSKTSRDKYYLYAPKIILKQDGYYINEEKIHTIAFVFDLIQSGTATKNTINSYLNNSKEKGIMHFKNKEEKEISVEDIIKKNKCKVKIYSIYAAELGKKNMEEYVEKLKENQCYNGIEISFEEPIKLLDERCKWNKTKADKLEEIYGSFSGNIRENSYAVIREYNQPKQNIMHDELMNVTNIVSLFMKRKESKNI